jgi:predicted AAA+ superfamily ATPase
MDYIRRDVLDIITNRIKYDHVFVIIGARQTGKTTLCENLIPQYLNLPFTYISFDDPDERIRFQTSAIAILESINTPIVILDEVQKMPSVLEPLKHILSHQRRTGDRLFANKKGDDTTHRGKVFC